MSFKKETTRNRPLYCETRQNKVNGKYTGNTYLHPQSTNTVAR